MMDIRAEFEANFPVPLGVYWDDGLEQYEPNCPEFEPDTDSYHAQYQTWQAATEAARGGEAVFEVRLGAYDSDGTRPATLASLTEANLDNLPHGTKLYTHPPAPFEQEPFAYCFTDVNGEAKELCSAPTKDDDPRDMRTITPLYKQPPAPLVPECPYHCGWHALHSIAVKRAAYFARVTIDDDYPEAVRSAGIELGEYAVSLTRAMLNAAPESDQ